MSDTAITKLIAAYDEYVTLLIETEKVMIPGAYAQGFRKSQAAITRGEELRAEIEKLKAELP